MDVEQLHVVLQQSFSADAAVRKPAEDTIRNLKNLPGSVVLLLQVAAEKQVCHIFVDGDVWLRFSFYKVSACVR